ncbi:hypothetical protein GCM10027195_28640 [Comamonas sediminis]
MRKVKKSPAIEARLVVINCKPAALLCVPPISNRVAAAMRLQPPNPGKERARRYGVPFIASKIDLLRRVAHVWVRRPSLHRPRGLAQRLRHFLPVFRLEIADNLLE